MQVVIDIPEDFYKRVMAENGMGYTDAEVVVNAFYLGTPIPKGKWIPQKGGGFCCSNCKSYSLHEIDGNYIHVSARAKYCHNCGAKMTEEEQA